MKVIGAYYKSSEIDVFVYEEGSMNWLYGPRIIQPPIIKKNCQRIHPNIVNTNCYFTVCSLTVGGLMILGHTNVFFFITWDPFNFEMRRNFFALDDS